MLAIGILTILGFEGLSSASESNKATQLIKVAQGLKENDHFLKSIGPSVSHIDDTAIQEVYIRAIRHHIETEILHLQMDLGMAYDELRRTQAITIELHYRVLDANIRQVEGDLLRLTKLSHGNRKTHTKHFLEMGYRELAVAKNKLLTARNTHPQQYLKKLQDSSYALRSLKQAQKYILRLAFLHDASYIADESDPKTFDEWKFEVERILGHNLDYYMRYLYDSHFKVYDKKDIFLETWNDPKLYELANPLVGVDDAYVRRPEIPRFETDPTNPNAPNPDNSNL